MSRHGERFFIERPTEAIRSICLTAVQSLGWRMERDSDREFVCSESWTVPPMTYPVSVEVFCEPVGPAQGWIALRGSNFGFGPLNFS
jgi:hypothetical protein